MLQMYQGATGGSANKRNGHFHFDGLAATEVV